MPRPPQISRDALERALSRYSWVVLLMLAASVTLGMQYWIGGATIYSEATEARRSMMHSYILRNELPPGQSWDALGANSVNIRIGVVYLAEAVHRATEVPVHLAYRAIDTCALVAVFLMLFAFLRFWVPAPYALIGLLYVCAITPLTYFLHNFHPWDRASLLAWLSCLVLLRARRFAIVAALLPIAVVIKFDIVFFPLLYFLAFVERDTWKTTSLRTAGMLFLTFGTYVGLRVALPGGFDRPVTVMEQVAMNVRDFSEIPLFYQPLLALGLPWLLGIVGWRHGDRFARACYGFALFLLVPLFLMTNFEEIRAEMPVLVLMMPAAVLGARAILEVSGGRSAAE